MQHRLLSRVTLAFAFLLIPGAAAWIISSCDSSGRDELEITGQSLEVIEEGYYQNVALSIHYETIVLSSAAGPLPGSAYATSQAPPNYRNKITSIEIIADTDFNPDLPAGTNLLSLFHLGHHLSNYTYNIPSLLLPTDGGEGRAIYLHLLQAPATNIEPVLTVKTMLDNGLVLESNIGPVTILK